MITRRFESARNDGSETGREKAVFTGFLVFILIFSLFSAASDAAAADMNIYLRITGVEGKAMDADHRNWIDAAEFSLIVEPSKKDSRTCQVHVLKHLDSASPALWAAVTSAKAFAEVKVDMVQAVEPRVKIVEQTMTNVRVGRVEFGQMVNGQPTETVTLLPEKVTIRYFIINPDGTGRGTIDGMVNCLL